MKNLLTNANFPRTADLRVYHLGVRPGEVANRIITVGTPSRARTVAGFLDKAPKPFELSSERGFLTITGRFKNVPISIVSIGMGSPNMDFFVREMRESVNGDMAIIRLGSCGGLEDFIPVTSVVVPKASVQISRNIDYDFLNPVNDTGSAYHISKPVSADETLSNELLKCLEQVRPSTAKAPIIGGKLNASADSFYSSQGRQTSFPDENENLIKHVQESVPGLATLEMETFHLFHLAACWKAQSATRLKKVREEPPLATSAVEPKLASATSTQECEPSKIDSVIRAAAAHMVFASRTSQDFITPQAVDELEHWTAQGALDALVRIQIPQERLHEEEGSVWAL